MKQYLLPTTATFCLLLAAAGMVTLMSPETLIAGSPIDAARQGAESGGQGGPTVPEVIEVVTNTLIFVVGVAAVIMLIIGAIRYVTSAGDDSAAKSAKNTILYAIVGLILALAAFAIVTFVLEQFA